MSLKEVISQYGYNSPELKAAVQKLREDADAYFKELQKSIDRESQRVIDDNRCIEAIYGTKLDGYSIGKPVEGDGLMIFSGTSFKVNLEEQEDRIKRYALQRKNEKIKVSKEHVRRNGKEPSYEILATKKIRVEMLIERAREDWKKNAWNPTKTARFCEMLFEEPVFTNQKDRKAICTAFAKDVFKIKLGTTINSGKDKEGKRNAHTDQLKKIFI